MSAANVETVRGLFATIEGWDLDASFQFLDEEIEFLPLGAALVEGRSYRGFEGIREWDRERRATWDMEIDISEFEDAGERVLVHGGLRSRGIASGVELDTPVSWVCALRAGKVVRIEAFLDRADAEAAARG